MDIFEEIKSLGATGALKSKQHEHPLQSQYNFPGEKEFLHPSQREPNKIPEQMGQHPTLPPRIKKYPPQTDPNPIRG